MTDDPIRLRWIARSLSVLVSFEIMTDFVSPALWVLAENASVLSRIARLSSSPTVLAIFWLTGALMVMPFVIMQIFSPESPYRRTIIQISNCGMIMGALTWVFMAFLSRNLDYSFAMWNFLFNGLMTFSMAALMANGLNNDQKAAHERNGGTV